MSAKQKNSVIRKNILNNKIYKLTMFFMYISHPFREGCNNLSIRIDKGGKCSIHVKL